MRVVWFGLAATTVVSEVVRLPVMSPFVHYGLYGPGKMLCFFMLGYLTPLTFGRFNNLNRGILFAALSAALVEVLQGLIGNGHSFHVYELVFKLGIILFGFMMGLDARFEGEVGVGSFRVNLVKK
jgi:hypothetical protein